MSSAYDRGLLLIRKIKEGNLEEAKRMIDEEDVEIGVNGNMPLKLVILDDRKELETLGKMLIEKGSDINDVLEDFIEKGNINGITKTILFANDVGTNIEYRRALNSAIKLYDSSPTSTLNVIETLLKVGKGQGVDYDNNYLIRTASYNGLNRLLVFLLYYGADIHVDDDYPLRIASSRNHIDVVQTLLDSGADVHALTEEALFRAISSGNTAIASILIDRGADLTKLPVELQGKYSYNGKGNGNGSRKKSYLARTVGPTRSASFIPPEDIRGYRLLPLDELSPKDVELSECALRQLNYKYRPIKLIGSGAEGFVYEICTRSDNNCKFVLKVNVAPTETPMREGEMGLIAGKAGIGPKVYEYGVCSPDSEVKYIVMERLAGETFDEYLDEARLISPETLSFIFDIYYTLFFEYEIDHGDLHPGNIFISERERPYLIDYGFAGPVEYNLKIYIEEERSRAGSEKFTTTSTEYFLKNILVFIKTILAHYLVAAQSDEVSEEQSMAIMDTVPQYQATVDRWLRLHFDPKYLTEILKNI